MLLNKDHSFKSIADVISTSDIRVHFGQLGEDCLVWHLFCKKSNGFYVDVGCHHPFKYSNTYLLHSRLGWRGINIDADERAISLFKTHRPNDINIHAGVGLEESEREFTVFRDGALNTFNAEIANKQQRRAEVDKVVKLQIKRLSSILRENLAPEQVIDYMNIDCEGLDEEVLSSNDWNLCSPSLISVEIMGMDLSDATKNSTVSLLTAHGYKLIAHYFATTFFQKDA